ncbi:fatty acyl-CoA reductase 1-like isoform X2 [Dermacentor albipictus]|uniref:fatty acyl-CoA reductase 1-like isoform X2 n=1 Tax=Dermacentor albipictus TaxID=60249 RepID=UPI0038FD0CC4
MDTCKFLLFSRFVVSVAGRRCMTTTKSRMVKATTKAGRTARDTEDDRGGMRGAEQPVTPLLKTSAWNLPGKRPLHSQELQRRQRLLFPTTSLSCAEIIPPTAHRQASTVTPEIYQQQPSPTPVGVYGASDGSQVASFYKDRVVLITGGTGFVGKVLLEKLLRSCSGLERVYLLVRSKKGQEPQARHEEIFKSPIFEHLKQEQPEVFEKVTVLAGDLVQPDLGLSAYDRATLVDNVSVVFHSGAAIKFNEPLRKAVEVNLLGTRRVLDLCRQMPNICALVHVSTAYCNCDKPDVHEVIYSPCENYQKIIEDFQSAGNDATGTAEEYLYGHPNTYTLTKSLAEALLLEERGDTPLAIVRPSTITASLREPLPGWVDNFNGCTGIVVTSGLGLLPVLLTDKKNLADIVPVDIVANTLICVAWHTAKTRPTHVKVYHCTSGTLQQHTWAELVDTMQRAILRHPLPNAISFPKIVVTNSQLWYDANLYCRRYLPALAADLALQLTRRDPRFVKSYKKVRKSMDAARYFVIHGWLFRTTNIMRLMRDLTPKDKQMFNVDMRSLDWYAYWDQYLLGIRKYIFKAEDSELPKARRHLTRRSCLL